MLEEENAPLMREERSLQQLKLMGVFDEIVRPRGYPIVCNFDCGHTLPMITIPLEAQVELVASSDGNVSFTFL